MTTMLAAAKGPTGTTPTGLWVAEFDLLPADAILGYTFISLILKRVCGFNQPVAHRHRSLHCESRRHSAQELHSQEITVLFG
jgi:hypothetical protein